MAREWLRDGGPIRHIAAMGQTIDTSHIAYVARLLRSAAPTMPAAQDQRLFRRAAEALENGAARLTHGVPATSSGKVDLLV